MTSITDFQFSNLLGPISAENPAGENLREDRSANSVYYQIKDARSAARASERRLDYQDQDAPSPQPFWRKILELAPRVLAERAKDLEIAAYLIEALIREQGFSGLRDGFRLVHELALRYWDDIYPVPDEDGMITRVAHLAGLNGVETEGTLIRPIMMTPVTSGTTAGPCSQADYIQAQQMARLDAKEQTRRFQDGAISLEMFERAVAETPPEFFTQRFRDLRSCLEEFERMSATLEEKCGPNLLHTSAIRNALTNCLQTLRYLSKTTEDIAPAVSEQSIPDPLSSQAEPRPAVAKPGPTISAAGAGIQSRQQALAALVEVADYFRQAEPHSPLSYAADQLVRWGHMSLPELMSELIPDPNARLHFFTQVGIGIPAED